MGCSPPIIASHIRTPHGNCKWCLGAGPAAALTKADRIVRIHMNESTGGTGAMARHAVRSGLALPLLLVALLLLAAVVRGFQLGSLRPGAAAAAAAAAGRRSRRGGGSSSSTTTRLQSIRTGGGGGKGDDDKSGYGPERIQDPDAALSPEEWQKKYGEEVDTTVLYDEKVRRVCVSVCVC